MGLDVSAPHYLREFWETTRCDHVTNFADMRRSIDNRLTKDTLANVLAF